MATVYRSSLNILDKERMNLSQLELLKSRRFLPLFLTQLFGSFNDNIFKNALVILITYRLSANASLHGQILITIAAGLFILPFFIFSATAGQLADKYSKSTLITIFKIAELGVIAFATLGFYYHQLGLLLLALFMLGSQAAFFGPVKYAILPEQLSEDELIAGNGVVEASTFISIIFGTILGGLLILLPNGELLITLMLVFFSILGFISSLYIPDTNVRNLSIQINYNFLQETKRVIEYAQERWDIYLAILGISWFWLIGAVFLAEIPVFTKDILHANEQVVTYLISLFSIGIAFGSLICNRLLDGKIRTTYVPLGALGITLFTIDLFFAGRYASTIPYAEFINTWQLLTTFTGWRITLDLLLISLCGGLYIVPLYTLLQIRSEKAHRARVIGSNNVINAFFMVVAAVVTVCMLNLGFSVNHVFLVLALANGAVAIYICRLLPDVLVRAVLSWMFNRFYKVKVVGMENYESAGSRVVIVSNHTSFLDAALLAIYFPGKLTFAIDTYQSSRWWIKLFLMLVDARPIDPSNTMSIKSLIEFVKQDKKCVIFPEGRLTVTGTLMKVYEGPGMIADKAGAKLLPVRIQGAQYTPFSRLKGKVRIRLMPQITITIFPAQSLDLHPELKGRERRHQIGLQLYDLMSTTMFESSDYRQTLFLSLIDAIAIHGRRSKMMEDIQRMPINYQQFITRSFILGDKIARKTKKGEFVGILLPNMVSNAITFFALQAYFRVPAMLNYSAGVKNVVHACQAAQIRTVYTSRTFVNVAKLTDYIDALKNAGVSIYYLEDIREKVNLFDKLNGLLMARFPRFAYKFINYFEASADMYDPETPAVVLFTSGSEGTPKGVVLSHKNIQANRYQMCACVDFNSSDIMLSALPLFHAFGLTVGMVLPILSGVKVFFYPSPLHYRIVPQISYDISATILFGTDTFLAGYAKYAHPYDFFSVRYVFAGAEKLRPETLHTWAYKFGVRVFEGYGATETSPVLSTNTPLQNKAGTVGRLLPGIQYRLQPVPGIEQGGTLQVYGPNIMKGYLYAENPGVITPPEEGWYDTGDVVEVDESGYVTIKGRVKRFAKIAGEMVSLTLVESQVNKLWPDYQHAVVNIPDMKKGEQIVLATTYQQASRDALVTHAKANQAAEISIPKKILVLKEMFLLASGKVDYPSLKEFVLSHFAHENEIDDELEEEMI